MGGDWKEMFFAAEKGEIELVKYHLQQGADPNYQHPEFMSSALIESARQGQLEVVKLLLEYGADLSAKAVWGGETALEAAKKAKQKEVVTFLKSL